MSDSPQDIWVEYVEATESDIEYDPEYLTLNFNCMEPKECVTVKKKDLVNMIPKRPTILACENCFARPGEKEHSKCGAFSITPYCRAHWPKHKSNCREIAKMRDTLKVREAECRAQGKVWYDPSTLRTWFKNNHEACEYAQRSAHLPRQAWHILEIYKGPQGSLFPSCIVMFFLAQDPEAPNDPAKVVLKNIITMPRKELYKLPQMTQTSEPCHTHVPRHDEWEDDYFDHHPGSVDDLEEPERLWLGYVHLVVGGHIAKLAAELEAEKAAKTQA
ncbi:hypothetical protein B0H17DRAFT_1180839 [Mycena rosella]|uniref:Uncharacterized protein n=1 Tax=Mycena rosella TaxID=1033263 RepID=A0AAD7GG62_MYCRO|nr:hypothetical protein B0H17DRAFT_1180839 [Mycena rosella]